MFTKVLFATDFTKVSRKAFEYLKNLTNSGMVDEVILFHVVDENDIKDAQRICVSIRTKNLMFKEANSVILKECEKSVKDRLINHAKEELNKLKRMLPNIKVRCIVKVGKPFIEIISLAEKEKVSLIIVGSHGKGIARSKLIGSCSESVIRYATCPVLVVK